jgi:hypothetical protein
MTELYEIKDNSVTYKIDKIVGCLKDPVLLATHIAASLNELCDHDQIQVKLNLDDFQLSDVRHIKLIGNLCMQLHAKCPSKPTTLHFYTSSQFTKSSLTTLFKRLRLPNTQVLIHKTRDE